MKNKDLGKSFEKMKSFSELKEKMEFPDNPMLIHKIQDALMCIQGLDFLSMSIRTGAMNDVKSCIEAILSQYNDNQKLVESVVSKEIMDMIFRYKNQ